MLKSRRTPPRSLLAYDDDDLPLISYQRPFGRLENRSRDALMWAGVTERFRRFHGSLQLTTDEINDGIAKQLGIRQSLQRAYWGPTTDTPPGFIVGSWGKRTAIRPPNDIDVFMQLPAEVYNRFDGYTGNK